MTRGNYEEEQEMIAVLKERCPVAGHPHISGAGVAPRTEHPAPPQPSSAAGSFSGPCVGLPDPGQPAVICLPPLPFFPPFSPACPPPWSVFPGPAQVCTISSGTSSETPVQVHNIYLNYLCPIFLGLIPQSTALPSGLFSLP